MSHAYFYTGEREQGIERALSHIEEELGLSTTGNPDVVVMRYGLLSVDEAREVGDLVRQAPIGGSTKAIVLSADRLFHEAQNALLKVFEEPPEGTYLYLIVPTAGIVLPTLRSRMQLLSGSAETPYVLAEEFLSSGKKEREDIVASLLDRAKSDKDDEKDAARAEARDLIAGLIVAARKQEMSPEIVAFLTDLDTFAPMLHERAAPLKLIFEHLLITLPKDLIR